MLKQAIGWLWVACAFAAYQTGQQTGASIEGKVVNQATGAPVKHAIVRLGEWTQETDDEGRFLFTGVGDGKWPLTAEQRGFTNASYGARRYRPGGMPIPVQPNQQIENVILQLAPQAVITGRVTAAGEPVEGARVAVLRAGYAEGTQHWVEVASATTLDNGEYRIPRLSAGHYVVKCQVPRLDLHPSAKESQAGYASTYYPATTEPDLASAVDITDATEIRGIDIRLVATPLFHVRGQFQPPGARALTGGYVALVDRSNPSKVFAFESAAPPGYRIDFPRIPPGSYMAFGSFFATGMQIAAQPVEVRDRDVESLTLFPNVSEIHGILKLKPGNPPVDLKKVLVEFQPVELDTGSPHVNNTPVKVADDLSFRFLIPYRQSFIVFGVGVTNLPEGCYLAGVQYAGKSLPESGIEFANDALLEITVGSDGGRVEGLVRGADDAPANNAVVALIPAEAGAAPRSVLSGSGGAFQLSAVPPGDYRLMAWEDVSPDDLGNPDFVKRFESQAVPVKVTAGSTATSQIRLAAMN